MAIPPSGVVWGSISGSGYLQSKIGIRIVPTSSDADYAYYNVQMWYHTKYKVEDPSNTFSLYYDDSEGNEGYLYSPQKYPVYTYHNSGSGWSYDNCIKIYETNACWTRLDYTRTITLTANFSGVQAGGGSGNCTVKFNVSPKPTYTISYSSNGGSGAPSSQTKKHGTNITLSSTRPTRTGYIFKNWNTKSNGSGSSWNPGETYTPNSSVTLYAQWTPNKLFLMQTPNGGTIGSSSFKVTSGGTIVYKDNYNNNALREYTYESGYDNLWNYSTFGLVKKGYHNNGTWKERYTNNIIDQGSNILPFEAHDYTDGKTISQKHTVQAIYDAIWIPNTYKVTYNANGGIGSDISDNATYDSSYSVRSNIFKREGYEFIGWNTRTDGQGETLSGTFTWKRDENITLYAQWKLSYNCLIKQNGKYQYGMMYIKQNGEYKISRLYAKDNGIYKPNK